MLRTILTTSMIGLVVMLAVADDPIDVAAAEQAEAQQRDGDQPQRDRGRRDVERGDRDPGAERRDRDPDARRPEVSRERMADGLRQRLNELRELYESLRGREGGEELERRMNEVRQQMIQSERALSAILEGRDPREEARRREVREVREEREEREVREEHEEREEHQEHEHHDEGWAHSEHAHAMERLEHMHMAIEHLSHAGLHDVAQHVRRHAEEFERDLDRRHHPPEEGDRNPVFREVMEQLEALRREVSEMREQMSQMRRGR